MWRSHDGFNLFALTDDVPRIVRLPLSSYVQKEITQVFQQQEEEFNSTGETEVPFDGKYKPDDGECLTISGFDDIDNLHGAIVNPLGVSELTGTQAEVLSIKALFVGYVRPDGSRVSLIQRFDRRRILSTKGLSIFYSGDTFRKVDGVGITLDTRLAAILADKTLRFLSFHVVRQIFDLTAYYIEATDADLTAFAAINTITVSDKVAFVGAADTWVRRKVALIKQSNVLDTLDMTKAQSAAAIFGIKITTINIGGRDTIVLPPDKAELKKLLRFLDEDYYQSALLSQNYITNLRRPV